MSWVACHVMATILPDLLPLTTSGCLTSMKTGLISHLLATPAYVRHLVEHLFHFSMDGDILNTKWLEILHLFKWFIVHWIYTFSDTFPSIPNLVFKKTTQSSDLCYFLPYLYILKRILILWRLKRVLVEHSGATDTQTHRHTQHSIWMHPSFLFEELRSAWTNSELALLLSYSTFDCANTHFSLTIEQLVFK